MNLENEAPDDLSGDALAVLDEIDSETPKAEPEAEVEIESEAGEGDPDGDEPEEADAQSDEASGDDDQPKGKSRTQKRIDQLTREKNDARREADYHRQQLQDVQTKFDQLQAQVQTMQPTQQQVEMGQQQGLNPQQVQDLIRKEANNQVEAERFNATVSAVKKTLEDNGAQDALKRLSNAALTPFEPEAMIAMSEAKYPARVANAITQNEEVFQKFSSLPNGVARARFIDRLDGRLESRASTKPKTEAKPTPRVRGAAKKPEKSPDEMSQAEFEAYSRKQGWME